MKKNKLIIVLLIFVAVLVVVVGHRQFNKRKLTQSHQEDYNNRLIRMAKTSARSGLPQMARALKEYQSKNGSYPPDLQSLHPDYIKSKAFIEEIDWNYRPRGDYFLLGKRIHREGKILVASIDDSLRFDAEDRGMLVASEHLKTPSRTDESVKNSKPIPPVQGPENKALDNGEPLVTLNKEFVDIQRTSEPEEPARSNKSQDKIKSSEEKDMPVSDNVPEIKNKYIPQTCFIWIDKKGNLGFSNLQYNEKNLRYIYVRDKWKRPQWERSES